MKDLDKAVRAIRAAVGALSDTPTMAERVRRLRPGEEVVLGRYVVTRRTIAEFVVRDRAYMRTVTYGPITDVLHTLRKLGDE